MRGFAAAAANMQFAWDNNRGDPVMLAQLAEAWARSAQPDRTLATLELLARDEPRDLAAVLARPAFDALRTDARFVALQ